jgi:hypothetical protein
MGAVVFTVTPSGGTATVPNPDYTVVLGTIAGELAAMTAAIALISTELTKLQAFLEAVQSPTGDFRTISPADVTSELMVTSALAKNIPPIVPTGGVTT